MGIGLFEISLGTYFGKDFVEVRMQKIMKISVLLVVLFTAQQSISGELFPFDPPGSKKSCDYSVQLSVPSQNIVANTAKKAKGLSAKDKKAFIKFVSQKLKNSVIRDAGAFGLTQETLYYAELLDQVDP